MNLVKLFQDKIVEKFSNTLLGNRSFTQTEEEGEGGEEQHVKQGENENSDDSIMLEMTVHESDLEEDDTNKESEKKSSQVNNTEFYSNLNDELNDYDGSDNDICEIEEEDIIQSHILALYLDYQQSIRKCSKNFDKVQENILKRNRIEHAIKLLNLFDEIDTYNYKIDKKNNEITVKDLINSEKEKVILDGRIMKDQRYKRENSSFKSLSKKYQKLYNSYSILENEYDEILEKYNDITGSFNPNQRIKNLEKNDDDFKEEVNFGKFPLDDSNEEEGEGVGEVEAEEKESIFNFENDNIRYKQKNYKNRGFKGKVLKNSKKLIRSNLDYQW